VLVELFHFVELLRLSLLLDLSKEEITHGLLFSGPGPVLIEGVSPVITFFVFDGLPVHALLTDASALPVLLDLLLALLVVLELGFEELFLLFFRFLDPPGHSLVCALEVLVLRVVLHGLFPSFLLLDVDLALDGGLEGFVHVAHLGGGPVVEGQALSLFVRALQSSGPLWRQFQVHFLLEDLVYVAFSHSFLEIVGVLEGVAGEGVCE